MFKTIGFFSMKTGKIYKTVSARKSAETRLANTTFKHKLADLQCKYA